jgi:hypothetical protein
MSLRALNRREDKYALKLRSAELQIHVKSRQEKSMEDEAQATLLKIPKAQRQNEEGINARQY